jgi:hypothetical protein
VQGGRDPERAHALKELQQGRLSAKASDRKFGVYLSDRFTIGRYLRFPKEFRA